MLKSREREGRRERGREREKKREKRREITIPLHVQVLNAPGQIRDHFNELATKSRQVPHCTTGSISCYLHGGVGVKATPPQIPTQDAITVMSIAGAVEVCP